MPHVPKDLPFSQTSLVVWMPSKSMYCVGASLSAAGGVKCFRYQAIPKGK